MVQITTGKSPEILGSKLVRGRDLVNVKWMRKGGLRRARCDVLRKVSKDIRIWVQVHLQRNVMDMHLL